MSGITLRSVQDRPAGLSEHLARAMARRFHLRRLEDGAASGLTMPDPPTLERVLDRLVERDWVDFWDLGAAAIEEIDRQFKIARAREREAAT